MTTSHGLGLIVAELVGWLPGPGAADGGSECCFHIRSDRHLSEHPASQGPDREQQPSGGVSVAIDFCVHFLSNPFQIFLNLLHKQILFLTMASASIRKRETSFRNNTAGK